MKLLWVLVQIILFPLKVALALVIIALALPVLVLFIPMAVFLGIGIMLLPLALGACFLGCLFGSRSPRGDWP